MSCRPPGQETEVMSPNPQNDWCLAPSAQLVHTLPDGCKVVDQQSTWETDGGEPITYYQFDYEGSCSSLEERERLPAERGLISWSTLNQVNSGNSQTGQSRAKLSLGLEGVTTIPRGSRIKRSEAPGPMKVGDDIVSSAWEHAAA